MKRLAFISDVHLDEPAPPGHFISPYENLQLVLADIAQKEIGEIVFGGDIGAATAHPEFFAALKPFSANLILGNHDKYEQVRLFFERGTDKEELYYKEEADAHTSLFLDSSADSISSRQLHWLKQELQTLHAPRDIILYIHHPVLPIDTPIDRAFPLRNRNQLTSLLQDHDGRVTVFCGHYHMNDDQVVGNIRQICTQSLAFQVRKESTEISFDDSLFGYRIIEFTDNKLDVQFIGFRSSKGASHESGAI